ncbi:hypothetical protein LSAT2_001702 [Lamellibrachia satsuma]|nr:hypothetical protein LSAT2_001702 [Lamellibrachia satsuma]
MLISSFFVSASVFLHQRIIMESVVSQDSAPFRWLRRLGWALVAVGMATMSFTLIDIAYTSSHYTAKCSSDKFLPDWNPCYHSSFVYLWVASGVWASVLVLAAGFFAVFISRRRQIDTRVLQFRKDALSVACGLLATVFAPVTVILHSMEAYEGKDTFYFYVAGDNRLHYNDAAKLLLPILIAFLGVVELCLTAATAVVCWRSPTVIMDDRTYSRRSSSRIAEIYSRPFDGATTWPSYWHRYGDRNYLSHDQRKGIRRHHQRGYSGSAHGMPASWYGGWGYDGRAKRKRHPGYRTTPVMYPFPYVYPMSYYVPPSYVTPPTSLYY